MLKASIVIPNLFEGKSGKVVKEGDEAYWFAGYCFDRIKQYTHVPYELILIDNGSTNGKALLEEFADIYIRNDINIGFARSCNQGFKAATGEYIVCMNNDIWVFEGWLEALLKTFEDNKNCGVAMPALFKETKDPLKILELDKIDLSTNYYKYGEGAEFGSCWLIKKDFLEYLNKIDGCYFDENFLIGFGEDRDLWRRVRRAGKQTYRTHKTRVYHCGNVTIGKVLDRKKYTIPNREYLRRMIALEGSERRLTEIERKELKNKVQEDFDNNKILIE